VGACVVVCVGNRERKGKVLSHTQLSASDKNLVEDVMMKVHIS
jgi:hypothetical protein